MRIKLFLTSTILLFLKVNQVPATPVISNLDQVWPGGDMGNFETVLPGQGYGFMFGTGANPYTLNSVTFEELGGLGVQVGIYTASGNPPSESNPNLIFAGSLGNVAVDSRPTQWPTTTKFIDYTSASPIILQPNTYYLITATEPNNGNDDTALTFNFNYSYDVAADLSVNQLVPSAWTYFGVQPPSNLLNGWQSDYSPGSLMVEVNASPVPEPASDVVLIVGCTIFCVLRFSKLTEHG